jgi:hypothetical protein
MSIDINNKGVPSEAARTAAPARATAVGDVVRLKSGGPAMLVERLDSNPCGGGERVAYFVLMTPTALVRGWLPLDLLDVVQPGLTERPLIAAPPPPAPPPPAPPSRELGALRKLLYDAVHCGAVLPTLSDQELRILLRALDAASS